MGRKCGRPVIKRGQRVYAWFFFFFCFSWILAIDLRAREIRKRCHRRSVKHQLAVLKGHGEGMESRHHTCWFLSQLKPAPHPPPGTRRTAALQLSDLREIGGAHRNRGRPSRDVHQKPAGNAFKNLRRSPRGRGAAKTGSFEQSSGKGPTDGIQFVFGTTFTRLRKSWRGPGRHGPDIPIRVSSGLTGMLSHPDAARLRVEPIPRKTFI